MTRATKMGRVELDGSLLVLEEDNDFLNLFCLRI